MNPAPIQTKRQVARPAPHFLAGCAAMESVAEALKRAAATDVRVVLYGEPGTGKSFAASHLHRSSARSGRGLRRLSVRDPEAIARLADLEVRQALEGGTLVLEGIHEATAEVQAVLMGYLEEWSAAEEGGEVPVRVVATSEADLSAAVAAGRFRADLFYLLEVFPVQLPPLRRRGEEIPALVAEFARRGGGEAGASPPLPPEFLDQALGYAWPGNLRELASLVQRAVPVEPGGPWRFPPSLGVAGASAVLEPFHLAKREFELSYVQRVLLLTGGNVTRAAELSGKARKDFYALMSRNRVDPVVFRSVPAE